MATLTGNSIASTYKDLLQVSNSNAGVDATLRTVDDGEGTASALSISSAAIQVDNIKIDGNTITSEDTNGNITLTPNGTGDTILNGNVGIGDDSPSRKLSIKTAGTTAETVAEFGNANIGGGLQVQTNGNLEWGFNALNSRNLTFSTNQTERLRILSGGGLTFNGDTATANALDDYEEGTWTPAMTYTTPGDLSISHSLQVGRYTKIGNIVSVFFDLRLSGFTKGTASGNLAIGGLPFTDANIGNGGFGALVLYQATFTSQPIMKTDPGSTNLFLMRQVSNSATTQLDDPDANAMYWGSMVYQAA